MTEADLVDAQPGHSELLKFFVNDERVKYFVLYTLDHLGLLEHGSEVSFSWLTEEGTTMLLDLNRALND